MTLKEAISYAEKFKDSFIALRATNKSVLYIVVSDHYDGLSHEMFSLSSICLYNLEEARQVCARLELEQKREEARCATSGKILEITDSAAVQKITNLWFPCEDHLASYRATSNGYYTHVVACGEYLKGFLLLTAACRKNGVMHHYLYLMPQECLPYVLSGDSDKELNVELLPGFGYNRNGELAHNG